MTNYMIRADLSRLIAYSDEKKNRLDYDLS